MNQLLISDEPNWLLKAISALAGDTTYKRINVSNGLIVLPLPTAANEVHVGYAIFDAPNISNPNQSIGFPHIIFTAQYPTYVFAYRATEPVYNSPNIARYAPIFGASEGFISYYIRVHRYPDKLIEYYRLISDVLAYQWLTGRGVLPTTPQQAQQAARAIAPYFRGVPENLRDYYIQEGKPFLDWLLLHL